MGNYSSCNTSNTHVARNHNWGLKRSKDHLQTLHNSLKDCNQRCSIAVNRQRQKVVFWSSVRICMYDTERWTFNNDINSLYDEKVFLTFFMRQTFFVLCLCCKFKPVPGIEMNLQLQYHFLNVQLSVPYIRNGLQRTTFRLWRINFYTASLGTVFQWIMKRM